MRLKRSQYILLGVTLLIVGAFTWAGFKTSEITSGGDEKVRANIDINALVEDEKNRLPESLKVKAKELEKSEDGLVKMMLIWDSLGRTIPAAYTAQTIAEKRDSEKDWLMAGSRWYNASMLTSDSGLMEEAGSRAISAFENALKHNPEGLEAKNALAACYVDVNHDVMKGVALLREVISKDSNNIQALFSLGMLSVQSGQLDKAKARFKKLTELEPFNAEIYYYLGDVHARMGEKSEAIAAYEKCKTLLSDKEAKKEIESLINKLKNI